MSMADLNMMLLVRDDLAFGECMFLPRTKYLCAQKPIRDRSLLMTGEIVFFERLRWLMVALSREVKSIESVKQILFGVSLLLLSSEMFEEVHTFCGPGLHCR